MRTSFYFALLLSLTSCTGCVDIMKERAKGNAAKRSKFHFAPVDYRKEGVNTEHLFSFTETSMEYNGKPFSIHLPMDSIFNIFGSYNRVTCGEGQSSEYKSYIWDNIGLEIVSCPEQIAISAEIYWDYLPPDNDKTSEEEERKYLPKNFFQGKILLNGIPLDNTSDMAAFCENKEMNKEIRRLWHQVRPGKYFWECCYQLPEWCFFRYRFLTHKLYLYDYSGFEEQPFFGYILKLDNETTQMHSFQVGYELNLKRLKYSPIP